MSQAFTAFLCLEALCKDLSIALEPAHAPEASGPSDDVFRAKMRGLLHVLRQNGVHPTLIRGKQDVPDAYSGPMLAQIDESSWIYVPFFEKARDETMKLFDPQANGPVMVKSVQFLQRWSGPGMLFSLQSQAESQDIGLLTEAPGVSLVPETASSSVLPEAPDASLLPEPDTDAHPETPSTGLQCLCLIGRHHGLDMNERRLAHEYALGREETSLPHLLDIAAACGLKGRITSLTWAKALSLHEAFPVLVEKKDGSYALLCNIQQTPEGGPGLLALSPVGPGGGAAEPPLLVWDREMFEDRCGGKTLLLKKRYSIADEEQPFGLSWFIPEFLRHKGLFAQIALSVVLITCISLLTPLFFQIVIDKVLPHKTYTTLNVLSAGMIVVIIYNCVLEFLKSYLLLYATNKIDINLSIRTFHHLMRLPLSFFESVPAGLILKHMQQSEKIRGFLSGNLFFAILDVCSLVRGFNFKVQHPLFDY